MARRGLRRRRKPADETGEGLHASVLIHLGLAWRAHQDGQVLVAIRHLSRAAEAISSLIETWSFAKVSSTTDLPDKPETPDP